MAIDPFTIAAAAALATGKIVEGFQADERARAQARFLRRRADSALLRSQIDVANISAAGSYRQGSLLQQFEQAQTQNQLSAYASGVTGHQRTIDAQAERFREELSFQTLQTQQAATMAELAGAERNLELRNQAQTVRAQGRAARTKGLFGGAETFLTVGGFI